MIIERIELHHIELPYVHPFETSFGREYTRESIQLAVHSQGLTGWGECVAGAGPYYSSETIETAWHLLRDFLAPAVLNQEIATPADVVRRFRRIRGHAMARATLENAVWDLLAQARGVSLARMLAEASQIAAGARPPASVAVGVSVGIEDTLDGLLARLEQHIEVEGYGRIKLKIKPGWDVDVVRAVRRRWPTLLMQVDANSAYTLDQAAVFRELDEFDLLLIEQPLHHEDMVDHARLQAQIRTPICLDESIHSPEHARWALDIDACRNINIKVGRVGGFSAAVAIHDLCAARGVPVWCGGMLETNVGRAGNLALAALPNFTLPGDISASARYFARDIAEPNFVLNSDSTIDVPTGPGLGVQVLRERLAAVTRRAIGLNP